MASGFALNPSRGAFESCRKAELILIAQFYGIDLGKLKLKREIKPFVFEGLVQRGVLGHVPEAELSGTAHPETVETRGSPAVSPRRETTAFTPTPTGSFDEVKLKVRLAPLNREREDRVEKEKRENRSKGESSESRARAPARSTQARAGVSVGEGHLFDKWCMSSKVNDFVSLGGLRVRFHWLRLRVMLQRSVFS